MGVTIQGEVTVTPATRVSRMRMNIGVRPRDAPKYTKSRRRRASDDVAIPLRAPMEAKKPPTVGMVRKNAARPQLRLKATKGAPQAQPSAAATDPNMETTAKTARGVTSTHFNQGWRLSNSKGSGNRRPNSSIHVPQVPVIRSL